jgi:hypothetical protein
MASKTVALLLADLGVIKSHSRRISGRFGLTVLPERGRTCVGWSGHGFRCHRFGDIGEGGGGNVRELVTDR